jgi:hypothetical protein
MKNVNLILHCGAAHVTRADLGRIQTPLGTETHRPIGHLDLVTTVEAKLSEVGNMHIVHETFGVTSDGMRMFGLLQVANGTGTGDDYAYVLGVRNSNDKAFPAGVCVGSGVFVCDNLAFSSEIVLARKHTKEIMVDLPALVATTIGKLADHWTDQNKRIEAYKNTRLTDDEAIMLLIKAFRQDVFNWNRGNDILNEWDKPTHPEFGDRTLWSFFNAVTEHLKPRENSKATSLWSLPSRTGRLHLICDAKAGLVLQQEAEIVNVPVNPVPVDAAAA